MTNSSQGMHSKRPGIGVLELLIVLAILMMVIQVAVRFARQDTTTQDLKNCEHAFSGMLATARQQALLHHKVMRINIIGNKQSPPKFRLEQENTQPEAEQKFVPIAAVGGTNEYTFPKTWNIKAIYQGAEEVFNKTTKGLKTASVYIMPEGIIPKLLIQLEATNKKDVATLQSEPFLKTFTLHNKLLKPPQKKPGKS